LKGPGGRRSGIGGNPDGQSGTGKGHDGPNSRHHQHNPLGSFLLHKNSGKTDEIFFCYQIKFMTTGISLLANILKSHLCMQNTKIKKALTINKLITKNYFEF
jgi:hypothetical protein